MQGRNCTSYEYRCSNSRCIPKGNLCDTICDCADTCEDEHTDQCSRYYEVINGENEWIIESQLN